MMTKGRYRRIVFRSGRRYVVCGLRARPAPAVRRESGAGIWLPGATFALVLLFSAYIIGRSPASPPGIESVIPHGTVARFTIDDFANASR